MDLQIIHTTELQPAFVREIKARTRPRLVTAFIVSALLLGLAAFGLWTMTSYGRHPAVFLQPGLLVPVALLVLLVVGALLSRYRARRVQIVLSSESVKKIPGPTARLLAGEHKKNISFKHLQKVAIAPRVWGTHLVLTNDTQVVNIPLALRPIGFLQDTIARIPQDCPGHSAAAQHINALASALQAAVSSKPPNRDSQFSAELTPREQVCEKLGCWMLLARGLWNRVTTGPVERRTVVRLWSTERFRLPFAPLLSFLDVVGPALADEPGVQADRLRLALALRFRGISQSILNRRRTLHAVGGPAKIALPLEQWRKTRKMSPPLRPGLPLISQQRYTLEPDALVAGSRKDRLPLQFVTAFSCRWGFAGIRAIVVYDAWGHKHNIPAGATEDDLLSFGFRLLHFAPHVMELHEETAWGLGAHYRLTRLRRALCRSPWAQKPRQ